ncbi:hypothetical protein [Flagellimonas nanhaiensis]|uniref:Uncharacterized protein n=1 Tax=Flagellimonas nanhaiensis TaxID=2292706 RepID=A0A371JMV5_9FLAO|nr:hypothetical protein [Allomuricauda nanhaiensis]RDY58472.1 hypothetical protein DX873_15845 [Allomuricauda nanhaiensis]
MKSKKYIENKPVRYTREGNRVNIKNNKLFTNLLEAIAYARQKRSYHYQIFNSKHQHAGYAVPK